MAAITIKSPKTIQDVAVTYTGSISNAIKLMTHNKLMSDNLVIGQKVSIPDMMLLPKYFEKIMALKASASLTRKLMIGAAIVGALYYANSKKMLNFTKKGTV